MFHIQPLNKIKTFHIQFTLIKILARNVLINKSESLFSRDSSTGFMSEKKIRHSNETFFTVVYMSEMLNINSRWMNKSICIPLIIERIQKMRKIYFYNLPFNRWAWWKSPFFLIQSPLLLYESKIKVALN